MGYNSTLIVLNDAIEQIRQDRDFGSRVASAIARCRVTNEVVDIASGNHANTAHVVETHHADCTAVVTVGGNLGHRQVLCHGWGHHTTEGAISILRLWADGLGYRLVKKTKAGHA